ncbi:C-type lectin domain family 14 member A [Plectropomus leopardus]|uniref:C-type lectin domain family 14 member A n=1 Tax=Plectropomus leopardus TaxID=160734 RepID=UPI001C4B4185|nr:C-type lectin domain family 14 member A [Plectropomus leopardus]
MASKFCWIYLWFLFRSISAGLASSPYYTVHLTGVSFDQALQECSPGILTALATEQEVTAVLGVVSESAAALHHSQFTFWVGLRKVKNECVVPTLPLRGFKWTEDGGEDSQVSRWVEEPQHTCTTDRCAALRGRLDGTVVTSWGLIAVTCKNSFQFICKTHVNPAPPGPSKPELRPQPATPEPATPEPATPEPATPEPEPAISEPPQPEPKLPTLGPKPGHDLTPAPVPELPGQDLDLGWEAGRGSGSCPSPSDIRIRSISPDYKNSSRIQVECWSNVQVELRCTGHPAQWRLPDDSHPNFTAVCVPCNRGFQKDASGLCVDIDECSGGRPCRHACLNTEGSFRCVCSDQNGKQHDEGSPKCADEAAAAGFLIPVLAAVAALVVLLVVVAVTVKCCLMRRSKKRAMKKAEKMAMKSKDSKDSFETANEKAAAT